VVKAYELSQDMDNAADAAGTVLIDRWLGLLVLFIQALVVLPFNLNLVPRPTAVAVGGLGVGAVLATALLFEPAWQRAWCLACPASWAAWGTSGWRFRKRPCTATGDATWPRRCSTPWLLILCT